MFTFSDWVRMDNEAYEHDLRQFNNNNSKQGVHCNCCFNSFFGCQVCLILDEAADLRFEWTRNKIGEAENLQECSSYFRLIPPSLCGLWVHVEAAIIHQYGEEEQASENCLTLIDTTFQVNNLGTWANACVYASLILSCMFMPSILIKYLKVKWTLVICIFCYSTYIAAQFYPEFYTLLPTAFILGMGAAPMWSAKCTYLTQVGCFAG